MPSHKLKTIGVIMLKAFLLFIISVNVFSEIPQRPESWTVPHFCTPSSADFKEYRYVSKTPYCTRNVPQSFKNRVYAAYKILEADKVNYTIDHLVPLFLGGSNDIQNLWPQHKTITTAPVESSLYSKVSKNELHATEALNKILEIKYKISK
jgi:hypothetical protein